MSLSVDKMQNINIKAQVSWLALCGVNLRYKRANPDGDEDDVSIESFEDVPLSVNLASVDLVEESHHDERVEDDREMLCWRRVEFSVPTVVDV